MLPVGGFQWGSPKLIIDEMLATPDNAEYGYVVETNYPEHLHDAHSDYPLAPEAMVVPESSISDY